MQGNWERFGTAFLKWAFVPAFLFGIGYFWIGPALSGGDDSSEPREPRETALVNQQPIQPGERRWIPVSPPQVNISVTRQEEETEPVYPDYPFEDEATPPPIEIPDDGDVDEAGVGGMAPPTTTGGDDGNAASSDGFRRAFKGIGN